MKKDWPWIVLLVAGLGVLAWIMFKAPQTSIAPFGPVEVEGSALSSVERQASLARVEVTATLKRPGFVTVHKVIGPAPADLIGTSAYLPAGENQTVTINLSEPMLPAYQYVALLHLDDGDQQFFAALDKPVTSGGVSVRADFLSPKE